MQEFGRREVTTPVQVFLRSPHPLSVKSAFSSFDAWRRNEGANRAKRVEDRNPPSFDVRLQTREEMR
jgi:hypothetical protein